MPVLSFILQAGAILCLVAAVLGGGTLGTVRLLRSPLRRVPPARRADLLTLANALPGFTSLALVSAVAFPAVQTALGLEADHCVTHDHHAHLCFIHGAIVRPAIAALGAACVATLLLRAAGLLLGELKRARSLWRLERLGRRVERTTWLPTSEPICATVGLLRPRVLVSEALKTGIDASELDAAIAHERAHAQRRDPLTSLALAIAALPMPVVLARRLRAVHIEAVEQACDVEAAAAVGDPTLVASSLLSFARLGQPAVSLPSVAATMAAPPLADRVRALLALGEPVPRRSWTLRLVVTALSALAVASLSHAHEIHHVVETLLHHLS